MEFHFNKYGPYSQGKKSTSGSNFYDKYLFVAMTRIYHSVIRIE